MKFGKLADISAVDFSLPPDPEATTSFLLGLDQITDQPEVLIGCTGWSMKEWLGKVYPPKTPTKDFLHHYSRQFATIELNTTHYRIPNLSTIQNWYEQSADDFRFCPKVPQSISHQGQLGIGSGKITLFTEAISGLREKLGVCFMQLPPYFDTRRIELLELFLDKWPQQIPLALEFRHESWFQEQPAALRLFDQLAERRVGMVITDVAGRRDVLHMRITSPQVLVRLVGNGLVDSDFKRADDWVTRWQHWLTNGVQQIYCFPHEPDNILAPEFGEYIHRQVARHKQFRCRGPKFYQDQTESQMSLF